MGNPSCTPAERPMGVGAARAARRRQKFPAPGLGGPVAARRAAGGGAGIFEFTKASFMAQDVIYPGEGSMCA